METPGKIILLASVFALCLLFEKLAPLRKQTQPKGKRVVVNLLIALVSGITLQMFFFPIVLSVSNWTQETQTGLLPFLKIRGVISFFLSIILLDYTLWVWHWLNHKSHFLWRFHNVHHVDLDMDVSTASRFHFGELIMSSFARSGQILVIGVGPETLIAYEVLTTISAQFHHSNIRLPLAFERILSLVFVTPRMHGIHHSIVREETDSNFSTIISLWDRLHRTHRMSIPQEDISIGVPSYRSPIETNFLNSLMLPFRKPRAWKLPSGEVPKRLVAFESNPVSP